MARKVAVKEKKLYQAMRDEGVSKKKASRVVDVLRGKATQKVKTSKSRHRITKPVAALTGKVKNLRPHR